jgi:hypothetical protein
MVLTVMLMMAGQVDAAVIVGGTGFLSQADANQLETWLGEGPITITNVYTKTPGDDSYTFHAAVDGKGRTFSVIEVLGGYNFSNPSQKLNQQVVGGYNPQSWNSTNTYNLTPILIDRTAFLFNLTTTEKQTQNLDGTGLYQAFNYEFSGPSFGSGNDLDVRSDLNNGYAYHASYGGAGLNSSITSGTSGIYDELTIGRIEIYTISSADAVVPEPATLAIWGSGVLGMSLIARRRRSMGMATS